MDSYKVRDWILKALAQNKVMLRQEAFFDIMHYVEHAEYEMALEYLLLELIEGKFFSVGSSFEVLSVAKEAGLDQDYHYDENFWDKLNEFCKRADLQNNALE